ncbi:hypothetical protein ACQ86N_02675 [Puia sp. P3]|uniref:hypothetical protein n=1 Tax=Puia sp. P3 TaxID=3423952 RepID=UPI003D67E3B6
MKKKNRKKESNGEAVARGQAPKGMRNKSRRAPERRYGEPLVARGNPLSYFRFCRFLLKQLAGIEMGWNCALWTPKKKQKA